MSPEARPASSADLEQVLAIEARRPTAPGWTRAHFERELSSERSLFLVLEEGGAVRGYAVLWKVPPEAQLFSLVIAPEAEGRGLGRGLLSRLVEDCRSAGLERITLEVSAANLRAIRLYEAAGFRSVGRRPKFYNDSSDAILMDLALR